MLIKYQGDIYEVYKITIFNGDTRFLIYSDKKWIWVEANECVPYKKVFI